MFKCKNIDGHPVQILQADFSVECFGDNHSTYVVLACLFMVLYVVGVPVSVWILLWVHKKHLYDPSQPKHQKVRREFGALFEQYEPKFWYCKSLMPTSSCHSCNHSSASVLFFQYITLLVFMYLPCPLQLTQHYIRHTRLATIFPRKTSVLLSSKRCFSQAQ